MLEKPGRVAVAGGYEAWELLFEISIQIREKRPSSPRAVSPSSFA